MYVSIDPKRVATFVKRYINLTHLFPQKMQLLREKVVIFK